MHFTEVTSYLSIRSQKYARLFFALIGKHLYRRPWLYILIGIILTFVCSTGFLVMEQEYRTVYLWIPRTSAIWIQYQSIITNFGAYASYLGLLLVNKQESLLTAESLQFTYDITQEIYNLTLSYNGDDYIYEDLCDRSYPTAPYCSSYTDSMYNIFFGYDLNVSDDYIIQAINVEGSPIEYFSGFLDYANDNGTTYINGSHFLKINYLLQGTTDTDWTDANYEFMKLFTDYWGDHQDDYTKEDNSVYYFSNRAFDDEVQRIIIGDMDIYALAICVMLVYLMLTLGTFSCIGARSWLAASSILVMLFALIIGFGIAAMSGVKFTVLVMLIPFMLLGVGVDDMIILVDCYGRHSQRAKDGDNDDEDAEPWAALSSSLTESGVSISLTSLCSSMAFFVGSASSIVGVRSFCLYAAWAFFANYVLQFLIFVPLMIYDERRISQKRNFCLCFSMNKYDDDDTDNHQTVNTDDDKPPITANSTAKKTEKPTVVQYILLKTVIPLNSNRVGRWIVFAIFAILTCGSGYICQNINTESDFTKLVPDDSYISTYLTTFGNAYEGNWQKKLELVLQDLDFSDIEVRDQVHVFMDDLATHEDAIGLVLNWLDDFEIWVNDTFAVDITSEEISSPLFYSYLQTFANDSVNQAWDDQIVYDDIDNPTVIEATRFRLQCFSVSNVKKGWTEYLVWNDYCTDHGFTAKQCFLFDEDFLFGYFTNQIAELTYTNMIFAGIGVFIILVIFLDLRLCLFIIILVTMIDVNLFGWMYICGIALDTISYLQLVMAVGLTVDYVIHVVHAIADAEIEDEHDWKERLNVAIMDMGSSVMKGAFTTLLGASALIFSESQAFRIFFQMFLGIILIASSHGLFLAPAVMGEMPFIFLGIHHAGGGEDDDDDDKKKMDEQIELQNHNKSISASAGSGTATELRVNNSQGMINLTQDEIDDALTLDDIDETPEFEN